MGLYDGSVHLLADGRSCPYEELSDSNIIDVMHA